MKKFKEIKNKTIPSPLRPKFRQKAETNIYFLSKRKFNSDKKTKLAKNVKFLYLAVPFASILLNTKASSVAW